MEQRRFYHFTEPSKFQTIMVFMQISRLRFKQSRIFMLIPLIYVLGRFVNFLVIFRYILIVFYRQIVFLKGLVKFMKIENFEVVCRCTPNSCLPAWSALSLLIPL